jgi:hypothetical protein
MLFLVYFENILCMETVIREALNRKEGEDAGLFEESYRQPLE